MSASVYMGRLSLQSRSIISIESQNPGLSSKESQNTTQYIMSDYTDKMGVATIFIERDINDVSISSAQVLH